MSFLYRAIYDIFVLLLLLIIGWTVDISVAVGTHDRDMTFLTLHMIPSLIVLLLANIAYRPATSTVSASGIDVLRPGRPPGAQIRINDEYTVNIPSAQIWDPVYHVLDGPTTVRYARLNLAPQKYRIKYQADEAYVPYTCFFHSPNSPLPTHTFSNRNGDYLIVTSIHGDDHEDNIDENGERRKPYIADVAICYSNPKPESSFVIWLDEIGGDSPVGTVMLVDGTSANGFLFGGEQQQQQQQQQKLIQKAVLLSWPGMYDYAWRRRVEAGEEPEPSCSLILEDGDSRLRFSPSEPQINLLQYFVGVKCFNPRP